MEWTAFSLFHLLFMSSVIHLEIEFKSEVNSAVWIRATITLHPSLQNNQRTNYSLCLSISCRSPLKSHHYLSVRHTNVSITLFHGESDSVMLSIPRSHPILQYSQCAPDSTAAAQQKAAFLNDVLLVFRSQDKGVKWNNELRWCDSEVIFLERFTFMAMTWRLSFLTEFLNGLS